MNSTDEYRFLEDGEIIIDTDEYCYASWDANRWVKTGRFSIGMVFDSTRFTPLRRRKTHPVEVF